MPFRFAAGLARLLIAATLLFTISAWLDRPHGELPPFGRVFNPFSGLWAGHRRDLWRDSRTLKIAGLKGKVTVRADRDGVKHIFAESDEDLYFAQGFATASDRLWQMDFIYRVAAGRLSEAVGARGLEFDKLFRKLGIPQAAAESAELMLQDPATAMPLNRYAEGVNAYIATLTPATLPFEFKLLNYGPEPWSPARSAHLMKFMAFNLAGLSRDLPLTRSQSRLSQQDFDDLFPLNMPIPEPIIPKGRLWPFPQLATAPPKQAFHAKLSALEPIPSPHAGNGSNNWAVAGSKSTTGRPILSNDVHLEYALPAIWYEAQLASPAQNVYGATLPGAPGVILGFNRDLAWAVTNGGTDVLDWYELRFRDERRHEYLHEGEWRPVIAEESIINVKGGEPLRLATKRTHFGPIVYDESETPALPWIPHGLAMRWAPLEASNELRAFLALNKTDRVESCRAAIQNYNWPDQNFLCADARHIGLWHNGQYPIRWKGQGRMISDGSSRAYDWQGWIPREQIPFSLNPERGFLSSANQAPTDATYPHYLGWPFEEPFRGERINRILRGKAKFSPQDIVAMQGDVESEFARAVLPALLAQLKALPPRQAKMADLLRGWDLRFTEDSAAAAIFEAWWLHLNDAVWSEKFPDPAAYLYPPAWRTAQLIAEDPGSRHFDQLATPQRETLRERALASLAEAESELVNKQGDKPESWTWAKAQPTVLAHAGHIPGLGSQTLAVRGERFDIFANNGVHGPVWKLVVALGGDAPGGAPGPPKAWAIYPGGQSGDPSSPLYDSFVERWSRNELRELNFLTDASAPLSGTTVSLEAP